MQGERGSLRDLQRHHHLNQLQHQLLQGRHLHHGHVRHGGHGQRGGEVLTEEHDEDAAVIAGAEAAGYVTLQCVRVDKASRQGAGFFSMICAGCLVNKLVTGRSDIYRLATRPIDACVN